MESSTAQCSLEGGKLLQHVLPGTALHAIPEMLNLCKVLPPDVTLAVCFLGCWLLREALMPMDIVRWAGDATLPFLRLPTLASQLLQEGQLSNTDLPLSLLQSSGVHLSHQLD